MSNVEQRVTGVVTEVVDNPERIALTPETELIDQQLIDSLGVIMLINALTEEFDVVIEPEEVTAGTFGTIAAISRFVEEKLAAA
jgi:acyl carrier protein